MRVSPALRAARAKLAMAPEAPGPLPDPALRAELNAQYAQVLSRSIADLNRTLDIDPDNSDAMGYLNLDYRAKADLEDSAASVREDVAIADHPPCAPPSCASNTPPGSTPPVPSTPH